MDIKIINCPYYIGEACDCCEGWWYNSYKIEVAGEFVDGGLDEEWYLDWCDEEEANKIIFDCIDHVFKKYLEGV